QTQMEFAWRRNEWLPSSINNYDSDPFGFVFRFDMDCNPSTFQCGLQGALDPIADFMRFENRRLSGHDEMKIYKDRRPCMAGPKIVSLDRAIRLRRDDFTDADKHFFRHSLIHEAAQR